jgi:hypothetical protein
MLDRRAKSFQAAHVRCGGLLVPSDVLKWGVCAGVFFFAISAALRRFILYLSDFLARSSVRNVELRQDPYPTSWHRRPLATHPSGLFTTLSLRGFPGYHGGTAHYSPFRPGGLAAHPLHTDGFALDCVRFLAHADCMRSTHATEPAHRSVGLAYPHEAWLAPVPALAPVARLSCTPTPASVTALVTL